MNTELNTEISKNVRLCPDAYNERSQPPCRRVLAWRSRTSKPVNSRVPRGGDHRRGRSSTWCWLLTIPEDETAIVTHGIKVGVEPWYGVVTTTAAQGGEPQVCEAKPDDARTTEINS